MNVVKKEINTEMFKNTLALTSLREALISNNINIDKLNNNNTNDLIQCMLLLSI